MFRLLLRIGIIFNIFKNLPMSDTFKRLFCNTCLTSCIKFFWIQTTRNSELYSGKLLVNLSVWKKTRKRKQQNFEFGHFTLLSCRKREINVPKCKTHAKGIVLLIKSYWLVTFSLPEHNVRICWPWPWCRHLCIASLQGTVSSWF